MRFRFWRLQLWTRLFFCAIWFFGVCKSPARALPLGLDLELGGSGAKAGQFANLRDLTFDAKDALWTLEGAALTKDRQRGYPGNARVQKFDGAGRFLAQFSIRDAVLDAAGGPTRLAVDSRGDVFICYPGADLVRQFASDGRKIRDYSVAGATAVAVYRFNNAEKIAVLGGVQRVIKRKRVGVGGEAIFLLQNGQSETLALQQPLKGVVDMATDARGHFWVLAAIHALYEFAPDGKLIRAVGSQTSKPATSDGSQLRHSLAVDSQNRVYAFAGDNVTRFDIDFKNLVQRGGNYKWFDPWNARILALDSKDRLWAASPVLINHPLFERHHFRPAIVRAEANFLAPDAKKLRAASALALGLKAEVVPDVPLGVAYDLAPFGAQLKIAPANFNVSQIAVEFHVFDAFRREVGSGNFDLALQKGVAVNAPLSFQPPRFGWYRFDVKISAGKTQLLRIGQHVGVTPLFPQMPKLAPIEGMKGTSDAPRQMFSGLPNMRLNASANPKSLDALEKSLAVARQFGAVAFVQFTDAKDATPASVRAAVSRFKGRVKFWEIINEPNLRMSPQKYMEILRSASKIIHEIDPEAQVLGPATVNISLSWIESLYKIGLKNCVDIFSLHDYEGHESIDPIHWRWKIGQLRQLMKKYGDGDKEIWQTERAITGVRGGLFIGLQQAIRLATHRDTLETLGVAPDHNNHFYLNQAGYSKVPSYLWSSNGPHPGVFTLRTRYAQTLGRKYVGTLDWGADGNRLFSALRYVGNDGETLILRSEGLSDQKMVLKLRGLGDSAVVDSWGNQSTLTPQNGNVEIVVSQLPIYLRLAPGQSVVLPKWDFGRNIAQDAAISYSATSDRPFSLLNNGIIEVTHSGNPNGGTDGKKIWRGEMPESDGKIAPQTLEIAFPSPRTFDKIVLWSSRPDNTFGAPRDYDLEVWNGQNWKTLAQTRSKTPLSDEIEVKPTLASAWDDDTLVFVHRFAAPVTAAKIRVIVRRATYGFAADKIAWQAVKKAGGGPSPMRFFLREIEIYAPN